MSISYDASSRPLAFAAAEIRSALAGRNLTAIDAAPGARAAIAFTIRPELGEQAYTIRRQGSSILVAGGDAAGAMYAGLDVAEAIRLGGLERVAPAAGKPFVARRGIKFNIPLDARTPSYSDNSDSAQANIPEMWSLDFWREFLDEMARHRYNVLSLWNLHPFPSIVKVPEYPEVALNDVMRTTLPLDDSYSHSGSDMVRPATLERLETLRQMSIGEKIRFWRDVMQYARDRGIEVYWITWNIFTFGAEGKYGITPAPENARTIDYFRRSVRETVLTYPLLAGIGVTAGEQMPNRPGYDKEQWLWNTYGEGIRDALKLQPERRFRLIHRYHMTGQKDILAAFRDYPGPFDLSFKYAIAHMYSTPTPPFIRDALPHLNAKLRTWLTVRNDDIYSFRWGDPAFARSFIRSMPGPDKIAGFYMGPDGYNWGREFLGTEPQAPRQLVMKKQWYSFLLWGRLAYDPNLPDALFRDILAERFPEVPVGTLAGAWESASKVFPEITRFSWGDIDLRWFPEACLSHRRYKGFYTVRHFMEGGTMPGSGNLDIPTWRERLLSKQPMQGKTPLEVAAALESYAAATLPAVQSMRARQADNRELRLTLGDLEAMAHLGAYYAAKIRGAAELALYDRTSEIAQRDTAVRHLEAASDHWKRYAAAYAKQYKPQLLNRVGYVDIPALQAKVDADVAMARAWRPGTIQVKQGVPGGTDRPFRP